MSKRTIAKPRADAKPLDAELEALTVHLSEVLRIALTHPLIPPYFYNDLSEAVLDYQNREAGNSEFTDSKEHLANVFRFGTSRAAKGGAS